MFIMSSVVNESEFVTLPRRRRINSLAVIKNQLLEHLNNGLAKLRGSPLINSRQSQSIDENEDDLLDNLGLGSSLNATLARYTVDPVRREQLIDKEIETLKNEEAYLTKCLADIETVVNQVAQTDEKLRQKEKQELTTRTEDFNNFQQTVLDKIDQLTCTKDKIDQHLVISTRLRDCLKRQLKETTKRRSLLKESLYDHIKQINKFNRKLIREAGKYEREVAYLEESFKNARLGDASLIEDYKSKEKVIVKELEERIVIRKSLEKSKEIDQQQNNAEENESETSDQEIDDKISIIKEEDEDEDEEDEIEEEENDEIEEVEEVIIGEIDQEIEQVDHEIVQRKSEHYMEEKGENKDNEKNEIDDKEKENNLELGEASDKVTSVSDLDEDKVHEKYESKSLD